MKTVTSVSNSPVSLKSSDNESSLLASMSAIEVHNANESFKDFQKTVNAFFDENGIMRVKLGTAWQKQDASAITKIFEVFIRDNVQPS